MSRDFLIELNEMHKDKKIKISPVGEKVVGRDGRVFNINAEEVIKATKKSGVDLMLDIDHYGGEAVGWFALNSLEARDDGIYASLELTKKGEELVANKAYRYLSPAYVVNFENDVRVVKEFHSVGLVNHPNLLKKSLNSKEDLETLKKENEALKKEKQDLGEQIKALQKEKEDLIKEYENKLTSTKVKNALNTNALLRKREEEALKLSGEALDSFLSVCAVEAQEVFKESDLKHLQKNNAQSTQEQRIAQSLGLENLD
ncbi:phage protease [Helicobacter cholecystus]|uniref:phage protease n=1 Tax=Helicobacter cholecystus TaxID=45498 RepID=UPI002739D3F9|nr:phage protease [Helicobacter cholecystus]